MLDKHVVEAELLCFFVNVARRLMATIADIVSVCPQESGQSLSHPEWKLEGKLLLFFFFFFIHSKVTTNLLTQWEGRCVCAYVCICVNICVGVSPPVRLCTRMHSRACFCVAHLCIFERLCLHTLTSRSGSAPQGGILSWGLTKTNPVSSFFQPVCVHVCIDYISRWERTNTAEQRARSLLEAKHLNRLPCSLQEGYITAAWKEKEAPHTHNVCENTQTNTPLKINLS